MKEFVRFPCAGLYEGWEERKRKAFLGRLVKAILDANIRFVGCVVSLNDFNGLMVDHKQLFLDPYYMAFQTVTRGMAIIACGAHMFSEAPTAPDPVALVYSYQQDFGATEAGRAQQLWHRMKENTDLGQWLGPYSTELAKNVYGLQAADLFAYELTQEFEHFFDKEPRRKMRWAMRQFVLSMGNHFLIKFYDTSAMVQLLVENGQLTGSYEEKTNLGMVADQFQRRVRDTLHARARE